MLKSDNIHGYHFISETTGKTYEIYQCLTMDAFPTMHTDILIIMYLGDPGEDEPSDVVGHMWGATLFTGNAEETTHITDLVAEYERKRGFIK